MVCDDLGALQIVVGQLVHLTVSEKDVLECGSEGEEAGQVVASEDETAAHRERRGVSVTRRVRLQQRGLSKPERHSYALRPAS